MKRLYTLMLPWLLTTFTGCSNLEVKKVSVHERACEEDDDDGFRYYLSRPYVIVKRPLLVQETESLVQLANEDGTVSTLRVLEGDSAGELIPFPEPQSHVSSDAVESLTATEVDQLRRAIRKDPAVQPASLESESDAAGAAAEGHLDPPDGSANDVKTGVLPEDFPLQITFLPDFDEQYAVKPKNWLAKNAFRLQFKDGWALTDVEAEHDSTTIALELIALLDTAVNAQRTLADARTDRRKALNERGADLLGMSASELSACNLYILRRKVVIPPGVYRLNKPWEIEADAATLGNGLLERLGLPVEEFSEVTPLASIAD